MAADTLDRLSDKVTKLLGLLNQLDTFAGGAGTGGRGSGGSVMPNSLGKFSGVGTGGQLAGDLLKTGLGAIGGVVAGASQMMPDVGATMNRMGGFYTVGAMSGGSMGMGRLKAMIDRNLTTMSSAGAGANLAALYASRGVDMSTPGAAAMFAATSSATKYLNIPTEAAGAGIERLTAGDSSARLLRMGIFTSDPGTGAIKNTSQIFNELYQRGTYGRSRMSAGQMQEDIRRGGWKSNIEGLGFDDSTNEMFKAYLVAKTQGFDLNYEDKNSVSKYQSFLKNNGYENPFLSSYDVAKAEDQNMETASKPYLEGVKEANAALVDLKNTIGAPGGLIETFGKYNAMMQTFLGDNTGAGVFTAATSAFSGAIGAAGAIGSYMLGKKAITAVKAMGATSKGGGAAAGAKGATAASKATKTGTSLLKTGSKLAKGSAALSVVGGGLGYMTGDDNPWDDWEAAAGGAVVGGIAGTAAGGIGAIPGAAIGAGIGYFGNVGGYYGTMLADNLWGGGAWKGAWGGSDSLVGTGGTSDSKAQSFAQPTAGPVTASYGQKGSIWAAGYHKGTDYGVPVGTPVYAAAAGTVSKSQHGSGSHSFGLYVAIEHGGGYVTIYGHLSQALVSPGQSVQKGDLIAKSGQSGHVTGPHLHFEVQKNGVSVDPGTLQSFVGTNSEGKSSEKGADKGIGNSGNNVLDTVLGVGRAAGIPINISWQGVKGEALSTSQMVGAGLSGGAMGLSSPVIAASGVSANTAAHSGVGGAASGISLSGTTDTSGGLQALQNGIAETSQIMSGQSAARANVTINLSIAKASDDEARRFAHMVKNILEDESAIDKIGSK